MYAPDEIKKVYALFDEFPMETLTKAWFAKRSNGGKQRSIELMKEHRQQYGIAGNCFDLAYWLTHEFLEAGIRAYPVGHDIRTEKAHVAVVAHDSDNNRYLCDLGDQWLQPIMVDQAIDEPLPGFFPAAGVTVEPKKDEVTVRYHRPNGKISRQTYLLEPIRMQDFLVAADRSQQNIYRKPLVEVRLPYNSETAHWEFYDWESFLSTSGGIQHDPPCSSLKEWAERIHTKTGYDQQFIMDALTIYRGMEND